MATSPGLLDLSIVTDRLIQHLKDCVDESELWDHRGSFVISVSGLAPEAARTLPGCQLSLYLFHIAGDSFHRNTYPPGGSAQQIPAQPLGLTLYYILSAHSELSYVEEQQAMSIGLKCFHEHPILEVTGPTGHKEELTLTIEPQTADEVARLWQSISSPLRMSAVYRVGVAFLRPPQQVAAAGVVRSLPKFIEPRNESTGPAVESGVLPSGHAPTGLGADTKSSAEGLATIMGAGFRAGLTEVFIRALAIPETTTDPPEPGRFRLVDATTLELRIPTDTPPGRYLLRVWPDPDESTIELSLEVP